MVQDRAFHPIGILYLSALLKQKHHQIFLVDAIRMKDVEDAVQRYRPDVLGISTTTGRFSFFKQVAARVKERWPNILTVFGGPHLLGNPQAIEEDGIDIVCLDEGEIPFSILISRLETGDSYHTIAGLWVKQDGQIFKNPVHPLLQDLDSLPFYDIHLCDHYHYCKDVANAIFISSRGCPYNCAYCYTALLKLRHKQEKGAVRFRSPALVVEEIAQRKKEYDLQFVFFMDPNFGTRTPLLEDLMKRYKRDVNLPFFAFLHPLSVTPDRVKLLQYGGCKVAGVGIESANPLIRENVLNRKYTEEQVIKAFRLLHDHGIAVHATCMHGLPHSTLDDDLRGIDLCIAGKADLPDMLIYRPFPGVATTEQAKAKGLIPDLGDASCSTVNPTFHESLSIHVPHARVLQNLALLSPLAVKVPWVRRHLKKLVTLRLKLLYAFLYKGSMIWLKYRCHGRYYVKLNTKTLRIYYHVLKHYLF